MQPVEKQPVVSATNSGACFPAEKQTVKGRKTAKQEAERNSKKIL